MKRQDLEIGDTAKCPICGHNAVYVLNEKTDKYEFKCTKLGC